MYELLYLYVCPVLFSFLYLHTRVRARVHTSTLFVHPEHLVPAVLDKHHGHHPTIFTVDSNGASVRARLHTSTPTHTQVTAWNKRCEKLTALSLKDVQGKPMSDLLPPEYVQVLEDACAAVISGCKTDKFELAIYCKDRQGTQELLVNGSVRRDVDGVKEGIVFVGQDISRLNAAIKMAQQVSKDYEVIFANAAVPILGIDTEGKVTDWNAAMVKCSGLAVEDVLGKALVGEVMGGLLPLLGSDDLDGSASKVQLEVLCTKVLSRAATGGKQDNNREQMELSFRTSEGQLVDLLICGAPRRQPLCKELMGVLLIAQDITDRKTLEMATRVCLAAKAATHARTEQLSFLCHEIRNPLNGVIGYTAFLEETLLSSEQAELVNTTQQCCMQLRRIVNDVLDLSSIEQGNVEMENAPFSVVDLVATVMSQVRVVMEDKGLAMAEEIATELREVSLVGDQSRIMQILSNFAWNACKFTEKGSVTFRVQVLSKSDPAGLGRSIGDSRVDLRRGVRPVLFSVIDTGPGIPEKVQENLFQPFVQGDKSTTRHHGGTGLGLSICRQLAKLMGGDVACTSTVGCGATFQLLLGMEVKPKEAKGDREAVQTADPRDAARAAARSAGAAVAARTAERGRRAAEADLLGGRQQRDARQPAQSWRSVLSSEGGSVHSVVSDCGSFVGSLRDSVMNSMEMRQRRCRTREHSDSVRSLEECKEQRLRRAELAGMVDRKSPDVGESTGLVECD